MYESVRFDRPVKRQFVHRASTAEVLPTDFRRTATNDFVAGLQWPRGHAFYQLVPLDSALVVESIRQLTILTAHLGYGVALGHPFVMPRLGFRTWGELRVEAGRAVEVSARLQAMNLRRTRSGELRSVRVQAELAQGETSVAGGYADALALTRAEYARVRGRYDGARPAPSLPSVAPRPAEVGRSERYVTLRSGSRGLEVIADPENPVLFDHLVDHVPGAALIESCLQAVRLRSGNPDADFARFDATFHRMVEFTAPNTLEVWIADECCFTISQDGTACAEAAGRLRGC